MTDKVLVRIDEWLTELSDSRLKFQLRKNATHASQEEINLNRAEVVYEALRSAVERHGPEVRYVVSEDGGSFDSEQEARDSCDDGDVAEIKTFILCSGCAKINNSAMEDADEWTYLPEVYFPCPEYKGIADRLGVKL